MDPFAVSHFSDRALLHDLKALVAQDCRTTAVLLTRIAEVDDRKLYRQAAHDSMYAYCLHELHFSEGAAYKHIHAARAVRRFPGFLVALAEGRVHLRAILMLAPHLTSANADDLLAAATHKTRAEIELLLAQRFPRPDLRERLQTISPPLAPIAMPAQPAPGLADQLTPERVETIIPDQTIHGNGEAPPSESPRLQASVGAEAPAPRPRMTPLAPERFGLQLTIDQETHDLLQRARALMSHQVPSGELAPVIKRALGLLVADLEKRKFAATTRPGHSRCGTSARHIPAAVKRVVWERDGGCCTFVNGSGQRCPARSRLEFDHENPVARGGEATVENLRLRCAAHNAYEAERTFGAGFMERKRAEAQGVRAAAGVRAAEAPRGARGPSTSNSRSSSVLPAQPPVGSHRPVIMEF